MSSELDRQGLLDIFVMEAAEALVALSAAVNPPGDALPSPEELQNQYVWAHKIRGASGIYGFTELRWSTLIVVTGLVVLFAPGLFEICPSSMRDGRKGLVVLVGVQMLALAALAKLAGPAWANLS